MTSKIPTSEAAVDPGTVRSHLTLAWDEAQKGCTRVVEVEGRLEWLDIPPQAEDGQEICFPGRGKSVPDDNRHGDLWVTLEVLPEPVPGPSVSVDLEVSPVEALTGARKTVETQGRLVWVRVPANVEPGQVITVRREGAEGDHGGPRGDLLVTVSIATSLPIPVVEYDAAPAQVAAQSLVRYEEPLDGGSRRRSGMGWAAAVAVVALMLVGGGAALLLPREGPGPSGVPATVTPLPVRQPARVIPVKRTAPSIPPVRQAETPGTPQLRPAQRQTAQPIARPRPRRASSPRAVQATRRRAVRSAAPGPTRRRFCGRCGRSIGGGSFCGGCGRRL